MFKQEKFNSLSHLAGAALSLVGLIILLVLAIKQGDPWKIISFSIYGCTLFLLYLASTIYHSRRGLSRRYYRRLDHAAIYLLIAGTYTPFSLITLQGSWRWSFFATVWGLAIIGVIVESFHHRIKRTLHILLYLFTGWIIVFFMYPLTQNIAPGGIILLVLGGVFYTSGVVFYVLKNKLKYSHAIWHLFVLAGSISHYLSIVLYLV